MLPAVTVTQNTQRRRAARRNEPAGTGAGGSRPQGGVICSPIASLFLPTDCFSRVESHTHLATSNPGQAAEGHTPLAP
ncbi:hypothetical protein GN956_G18963 [Arapaima gigas]